MNALFLTQIVPYPPDSGPKVKTYHVLRYLAERGHRVTLTSFVRPTEEKHLVALRPYCAEIHLVPIRRSRLADAHAYLFSLRGDLPFLVTRDDKSEMRNLVNRLIQQQHFDIVHADQLTMAQFALSDHLSPSAIRQPQFAIRSSQFLFGRPSVVFDAHNAVWTIIERSRETAPFFLKPLLAEESRRIKHYEGMLVRQCDHTLAVSEVDKYKLLEAADHDGSSPLASRDPLSAIRDLPSKISVVPIAVDSSALQPLPLADSKNIISISTLYYPPNADGVRWFVNQVFPLVRQQMPDATLTIIGPRPPKDLTQFAIRNSQFVTITGYVPDIHPYLRQAAVMVVPVRAASGMRVRILEALARGIPVVTTTTGLEGIDAKSGEHLLVADEPADFAQAVVRLLQDRELAACLARNGRRLVEQTYDWRVVLPRLESVYESLAR